TDGGGLSASTSFLLTVGNPNTLPMITSIADQTTPENLPLTNIFFFVFDDETSPGNLVVTASSSNSNLVSNANLNIYPSQTNRLTVTPTAGMSGTTVITVTVTDSDGANASTSFLLKVFEPQITALTPESIAAGVTNLLLTVNGSNFVNGATV